MTPATESGWNDAGSATLHDIVERTGSLPPAAALLMLDDVLERLEGMSSSSAPAVQLEPALVLVDHYGRCHVRTLGGAGGTDRMRYAAPEARSGGHPAPAAYVYAATAVFVEALTGMPADVGRVTISSPTAREADALSQESASPAIRRLVEQGLADDPSERLSNPSAMRAALAAAADACFPSTDWRGRGRSWLSDSTRTPVAAPVVGTPSYTPAWLSSTPPSTSVTAPWVPAPRPGWDEEPFGAPTVAPGFFRRIARRDPPVIAGFLFAFVGVLLVIIGMSVGAGVSGPNTSAAATHSTAGPSPAASGSGPTPGAIGSEFLPAAPPPPTDVPSASPTQSAAPAQSPAPTALPTDQGIPSFSPISIPTEAPPPATPTPCSSFLGLGC
jgi:serine/threonine protein kinase